MYFFQKTKLDDKKMRSTTSFIDLNYIWMMKNWFKQLFFTHFSGTLFFKIWPPEEKCFAPFLISKTACTTIKIN